MKHHPATPSPRHLRFDSGDVLKKRDMSVRPTYQIALAAVLILIGCWLVVKVGPAVIERIDPPVVYRSNSTQEVIRIEIGARVYTPESDPEWKARTKKVLQGAYSLDYVQ